MSEMENNTAGKVITCKGKRTIYFGFVQLSRRGFSSKILSFLPFVLIQPDEAAVAWGPGEPLVMEEILVDPPQKMEVRIKVLFTSICHTDLSAWKGEVIISIDAHKTYPKGGGTSADIVFIPL